MAARFLVAVFSSFFARHSYRHGTFWHRILSEGHSLQQGILISRAFYWHRILCSRAFLSAGHSYWHRILFSRAFLSAGHSFSIAFFSAGYLIGIVFFSAGHSFLDCIRPAVHSIGRGFGEQGILSWNAFNLQGIL